MSLGGFFERYFVDPIRYNQGYNIVNTTVYAIILGVAVVLLYKFLKRIDVRVNEEFFKALMPYVLLGPLMRAMTDLGMLPRTYLTVSPGGYFVIAGFAIAALLVARKYTDGPRLYGLYRDIGLLLLSGLLFILVINYGRLSVRWSYLLYFVPVLTVAELSVWLAAKKFDLIRNNGILFYTHFYDATTTFVGLQFFGFWEQHVLARKLISLTGTPAAMYLEKLLILLPVVYILDRLMEDEDPDLINFVKLAIFILGFGPGTRNLLIVLLRG